MKTRKKIYLASSWRNIHQPEVLVALRGYHDVYDFRNPKEGDSGFHWEEIDKRWQYWTRSEYRVALSNPLANSGFKSDFDAMKWADTCVLLLPCGRSAHLEAGYFVGAAKPLHIYLADPQTEPELMYKMATGIHCTMDELINAL